MAWLTEKERVNTATRKKETYWTLGWRLPTGKVRSKSLGFCTKEEAKKALKVLEGKLVTGEAVEPTTTAAGSSPAGKKDGQTLERYLDDIYVPVVVRDKAFKTGVSARTSANALKPILGKYLLSEIDYRVVDAYITKRLAMGRASRTVRIELWALRGCLEHAVECGLLAALPKLPAIKGKRVRPHRFLTDDESRRLLDALRPDVRGADGRTRDPVSYLAILFALNLGLRKGEILSRSWTDVKWSAGPNGALLVDAKPEIGFEVKTRRSRVVPLTPELKAELLRRHAAVGSPSEGWIFPAPDSPGKPRQDFRYALALACKRAKLDAVHPHALRHTWASRLAMAGVDRRTLMELGGWSSGQMLDEVYAHVTDVHKSDVMARAGIGPRVKEPGD